jgi:hypothetical protein
MKILIKFCIILMLIASVKSIAGSPVCDGQGENKLSWPAAHPIWEFCYLAPNQSSAADGSSLEIRDAYYNGIYAIERAHIPMLFANYTTSTCYRDWKDTLSSFLRPTIDNNTYIPAITTCDVSTSETEVVGNCPFKDLSTPDPTDTVGDSGDCVTGVQVESFDDRVVLTTNHSASWYKYSSRFTFYLDGRIEPRFGFGNSTGTFSGTTHWHHAYYRINFDIDNTPNDDEVFSNSLGQQTEEFIDFRSRRNSWRIIDSQTGRGYRVEATDEDYLVDISQPPHNPSNYHNTDVMVTKYKLINNIPEYSDTPGLNNLGTCAMDETELVNNESIENQDIVFWYRTAVNDLANAGLVCKFGGPVLYPEGDWNFDEYYDLFIDGFE